MNPKMPRKTSGGVLAPSISNNLDNDGSAKSRPRITRR
jgi:hypothetical protein